MIELELINEFFGLPSFYDLSSTPNYNSVIVDSVINTMALCTSDS